MSTPTAHQNQSPRSLLAPVTRGVGLLLHIPGLMALLAMPICVLYREWHGLRIFAITLAVSLASGQLLYWLTRNNKPTLRRHAMLIAAMSWLGVSAIGALPFILTGQATPLDGLFESLSGFTSTGMSVLADTDMPHYLRWWRSLSEWVGGVGVIVLLLSVIPPGHGALELYYSETRDQKLLPNVRSTAQAIWSIYVIYTLLAIGLLWLGGAPVWIAVNHGMTAIATGGFAIPEDGLANASPTLKLLYIPIMSAGAISFFAHYRAFADREPRRALFGSSEQKLFWAILVIGGAILIIHNHFSLDIHWIDSAFLWTSTITTTGFQSLDITDWHAGILFYLAIFTMIGGTSGSTAGGFKITRIVLLYKALAWELVDVARKPREVIRLTLDGQAISRKAADSRIRATTILAYAWFLTATAGILLFSLFVPRDTPLQQILFEVFSLLSNTGLNTDLVSPELTSAGKITAMLLMWMGRLEILPVMVLIAMSAHSAMRGRSP